MEYTTPPYSYYIVNESLEKRLGLFRAAKLDCAMVIVEDKMISNKLLRYEHVDDDCMGERVSRCRNVEMEMSRRNVKRRLWMIGSTIERKGRNERISAWHVGE
ncbi:hypothetical protein QCA50_016164 [Cerrena zonata]|uniref:Uncharacterized protein n=1 Tax=Cerrena zonata TaxID=2478898 RepID=A0AAW0FPA0_9APHY